MSEPTHLYRAFASDGSLLYIGIGRNWARRWVQHAERSPFFADVVRLEVETHPTREAALEAERLAIIAELPAHNVVHHPERRPHRKPTTAQGCSPFVPDAATAMLERAQADDPRIDALVEAATILGRRDIDTDYSCACAYWHGNGLSLRSLVIELVGWERGEAPKWLCSSEAYDLVYQCTYNRLADCAWDCGSSFEKPYRWREQDILSAIRCTRNHLALEQFIVTNVVCRDKRRDRIDWAHSLEVALLVARYREAGYVE